MSTDKTDYLEAETLDRIFANESPDGAVNGVYVALFSVVPSNSPDASNEINGGSYSSKQVTASGFSVTSQAAPRRYENDSDIDFGVLDSSSQITVAGVVLVDGPDTLADNSLYADSLNGGSTTVEPGDKFEISAGDLTVEED
jgi:hypothetical protein